MGRLDFSVIDKKIKPPSEIVRFGGRVTNYKISLNFLEKLNREYSLITEGSTNFIDYGGQKTRFIGEKKDDKKIDILQACKSVKWSANKFQEENGKLKGYKYKSSWQSPDLFNKFILDGGREVHLVDIKHCYWRILFIHDVISEKLYLKYKDNRDARLVSVGCLNKTRTIAKYKGKKLLDVKAILNPLRWAWNFVCWFTYKAVNKALIACKGNVFAYHSDGLYVPDKYSETAATEIRELNLECAVVKYTVVGWNLYFTVLEDNKTGKLRRANLGNIKELKKVLPYVNMKKDELEYE